MTIGIIGLGLIGGSIAKDLSHQLMVNTIGVDANASHLTEASALDLCHRYMPLEDMLPNAEIIILATPVSVIESMLADLLDQLAPTQTLIDVGSTKAAICRSVRDHVKRDQYVAAHPLCGTEYSGPSAALNGLFAGKRNIVCEPELTDAKHLERSLALFTSLGLKTIYMDPEAHDRHLAYVSHLSHVTSFALGLTVLNIEKDEKQIFNLAGTGFASTARLAKSNPKTWADIFSKNNIHLVMALQEYIHILEQFKRSIQSTDHDYMQQLMTEANEISKFI